MGHRSTPAKPKRPMRLAKVQLSPRPRRCWRRRGLCQGHAHGRPRGPGLCDTRLDLSGIDQGFYRACPRISPERKAIVEVEEACEARIRHNPKSPLAGSFDRWAT